MSTSNCCSSLPNCATPVMLLPGSKGDPGIDGTDGTDGISAFTTLTANFTIPAVAGTAVATVGTSAWCVIGEPVYLQNGGTFYVTAISDATHVTLQNPAAETGNLPPATVVASGNRLAPSGFKGAPGTPGAPGTGVTVATKGDIQTFAGAPANLAVGTNGQILRSLSSAGTGLDWEQIIPNASGSTDNQIPRLDSPVGTETPANLQTSSIKLTDNGALQHTGGNAKGTDAVDIQPSRAVATQVASGNNSTIGGGRNNTASAQDSIVGGGEGNNASGAQSTIGGGTGNAASAVNSTVAGGSTNTASDANATVGGGGSNIASGSQSVVSGGSGNTASDSDAAVVGGTGNTASAQDTFVGTGQSNVASAQFASVVNGAAVEADKYGQFALGSGVFSGFGICQTSQLMWRRLTTDATANQEIFLDGGGLSQRATVPTDTTWAFFIMGMARRDNGDSITFEVKGAIQNNGGTTTLVDTIIAAVIADGTGAALTIANFTVDADNANDSLRIRVTGIAGQNWRWAAHARLVELGHTT